MSRYADLPTDLRYQDTSLNSPPVWFSMVSGLGQQEYTVKNEEVIKLLETANQEKDPNIPRVAYKYTQINNISPLFRKNLNTWGFGDLPTTVSTLRVASAAVSAFYGYRKHGDSKLMAALWGIAGFTIPVIVPGIAIYKGFGKR